VALLFGAANEKTGEKILARKFQECWRAGYGHPPLFFGKLQKFDGVGGEQLRLFADF